MTLLVDNAHMSVTLAQGYYLYLYLIFILHLHVFPASGLPTCSSDVYPVICLVSSMIAWSSMFWSDLILVLPDPPQASNIYLTGTRQGRHCFKLLIQAPHHAVISRSRSLTTCPASEYLHFHFLFYLYLLTQVGRDNFYEYVCAQ